ncbi:hypothetical protein WA158_007973 [Blastocystis sp. Blastoise]
MYESYNIGLLVLVSLLCFVFSIFFFAGNTFLSEYQNPTKPETKQHLEEYVNRTISLITEDDQKAQLYKNIQTVFHCCGLYRYNDIPVDSMYISIYCQEEIYEEINTCIYSVTNISFKYIFLIWLYIYIYQHYFQKDPSISLTSSSSHSISFDKNNHHNLTKHNNQHITFNSSSLSPSISSPMHISTYSSSSSINPYTQNHSDTSENDTLFNSAKLPLSSLSVDSYIHTNNNNNNISHLYSSTPSLSNQMNPIAISSNLIGKSNLNESTLSNSNNNNYTNDNNNVNDNSNYRAYIYTSPHLPPTPDSLYSHGDPSIQSHQTSLSNIHTLSTDNNEQNISLFKSQQFSSYTNNSQQIPNDSRSFTYTNNIDINTQEVYTSIHNDKEDDDIPNLAKHMYLKQ